MAKEQSRARETSNKHSIKVTPVLYEDDCETSSEDYSDYSDSDYDDEDFEDSDSDDIWKYCCLLDDGLRLHIQHMYRFHSSKKGCQSDNVNIYNPEMAAKNAQKLVDEEEREKRKAEKRRAKKKRRREKKKEEKERLLAQNKNDKSETEKQDQSSEKRLSKSSKSSPCKPSSSSTEDVDDGEEFLDINSAFVSVAVSKKKKNATTSTTAMEKTRPAPKKIQVPGNQNVVESERLAVIGYKMASKEQYEQAVEYFTKAIRLVHDDHRFFSNRSFCHCQLGHYTKALKDADRAIALAPSSPKGYYRRGEALKGLNQYKEAEEAFERVVELDEECEDAVQELEYVKTQQLVEMGFGEKQACAALLKYCSVQAAVDALTSSNGANNTIFFSDDEEETVKSVQSTQHVQENQIHQSLNSKANKMDPTNPEGHLSLWVGNVSQEVTEKQLIDLFSKFGVVLSVRLLPEKYCAFINFRDKCAPGPAMRSLQGREVGGERLLIRYPNNPVPEAHQQIVIKRSSKPAPVAAGSAQAKVTGPVNGDECHFWRTTGCAFGSKCRYKHLKENKGVDKKPWQKAS